MNRLMKAPFLVGCLTLLLPFPLSAQAAVATERPPEWATVIGPFPQADSDAGKADLAIVLWHQRTRTPEEIRQALAEVKLTAAVFSDAIGRPLSVDRFPRTAELLDKMLRDIKVVTDALKRHYLRPRPYQANSGVLPAIEREPSPSYPSGHATRGMALALVLAELAPERREALLIQGRRVGVNRVIGGVHYPSDIEAGQRLAERFGQTWLADPANRTLVEAVRSAEWLTKR